MVRDLRRREASEDARSLSVGRGTARAVVMVVVIGGMVGAGSEADSWDFGFVFVLFLDESSLSVAEAAFAAWAEEGVTFFAFLGERGLLIFERRTSSMAALVNLIRSVFSGVLVLLQNQGAVGR